MERELKQFIDQTMAKGATYVDARWYPFEESNSLVMWNGNLKALNASSESGVGVRVLYRGAWGFSASSSIGNLGDIFDKAYDNARVAAERVTFPVRLAEKDALQASFPALTRLTPSPCQCLRKSLSCRKWIWLSTSLVWCNASLQDGICQKENYFP